jgi:hypothetical protein
VTDSYLGRADLEALGLPPAVVSRLLRNTPFTGHDDEPVVEADRLQELLDMLDREGQS